MALPTSCARDHGGLMKPVMFDPHSVPAGPERRAMLRARGLPVVRSDFSLKERKILLALPPMTTR